ncbi:MAG: helix-turn-helix domain-containing protein [Ruminococcaceae bacterium]|nr:helix-turn-helix domain-containing protein [Oscillospiraceae bacterium]
MDKVFLDFSVQIENVNIDVRVDYLNKFYNIQNSSFSAHTHAAYEAYFIENGSMSVVCNDQRIELKERDILIIAPGTIHNISSCSNDLKRFNFRFVLCNYMNTKSEYPYLVYQDERLKKEIFSAIESIHLHISNKKSETDLFRIKAYLSIIISHIVDHMFSFSLFTHEEEHSDILAKCLQIDNFFSDHYAEQITIAQLADELHFSKTHTNRILKKYIGMSFIEKLMHTRLQAAKKHLMSNELSVNEIAERCGYTTLRGFELFFMKQTKMLPNEYRKKQQINLKQSK